jgi:hypothetical protein
MFLIFYETCGMIWNESNEEKIFKIIVIRALKSL